MRGISASRILGWRNLLAPDSAESGAIRGFDFQAVGHGAYGFFIDFGLLQTGTSIGSKTGRRPRDAQRAKRSVWARQNKAQVFRGSDAARRARHRDHIRLACEIAADILDSVSDVARESTIETCRRREPLTVAELECVDGLAAPLVFQ